MNLKVGTTRIVVALVLCATAAFPALARTMVSIKGNIVNMREGPSTRTNVLWELKKGYPLEVLKRKGSWLYVRDFENDRGWVTRSLTGKTPHYVVKASVANVRRGPGTQHRIVDKAARFDLLKTLKNGSKWVQVKLANGKTGWVAKRLLWGW